MNCKQINGRITSGVKPNASVFAIIAFICEQLPFWRDDPNRATAESEGSLNSQLYKFLNVQARKHLPMFFFGYEEPQHRKRKVDISVLPTENMTIEAQTYSVYDPVLVIECKRLPAPSKDREKEYVTGTSPDKKTGGIQRFKLGEHGSERDLAVMIAYIQNRIAKGWVETINKWIRELATKPIGDGCVWSNDEVLHLCEYNILNGVGKCKSKHSRSCSSQKIEIYHIWISMNQKSA